MALCKKRRRRYKHRSNGTAHLFFLLSFFLLPTVSFSLSPDSDSSSSQFKLTTLYERHLKSQVKVTLVQINDTYELLPNSAGVGGVAKLKAYIDSLKAQPEKYGKVVVVHVGDIFSPSPLNLAHLMDMPFAGMQMVDVFNEMVDIATVGNHEFDPPKDLCERNLNWSTFDWVTTNVRSKGGNRLHKKSHDFIQIDVHNSAGETMSIGFVSATIDDTDASLTTIPQVLDPSVTKERWVEFADPIPTAVAEAEKYRDSVDVMIGLSHLEVEDSIELANTGLFDRVLGGHIHEKIDAGKVTVSDVNLRGIFTHTFTMDTESPDKKVSYSQEFVELHDDLPEDKNISRLVKSWIDAAFASFATKGYRPADVIGYIKGSWDLTEKVVRSRCTIASAVVMNAIYDEAVRKNEPVDLVLYNSGNIRLDDILGNPNKPEDCHTPITQINVLGMLPYMESVDAFDMLGSTLIKLMEENPARRGSGMYLQYLGMSEGSDGILSIGGEPIDPNKYYRVAGVVYLHRWLKSNRYQGIKNIKNIAPIANQVVIRYIENHDGFREGGAGLELQKLLEIKAREHHNEQDLNISVTQP